METLSDKEYEDTTGHDSFYKEDVKEFIKQLKEELIGGMRDANVIGVKRFKETIDELAGDKLL